MLTDGGIGGVYAKLSETEPAYRPNLQAVLMARGGQSQVIDNDLAKNERLQDGSHLS